MACRTLAFQTLACQKLTCQILTLQTNACQIILGRLRTLSVNKACMFWSLSRKTCYYDAINIPSMITLVPLKIRNSGSGPSYCGWSTTWDVFHGGDFCAKLNCVMFFNFLGVTCKPARQNEYLSSPASQPGILHVKITPKNFKNMSQSVLA